MIDEYKENEQQKIKEFPNIGRGLEHIDNLEITILIHRIIDAENSHDELMQSLLDLKNYHFTKSSQEIYAIESLKILNFLIHLITTRKDDTQQAAFDTIIQISGQSEDLTLLLFEEGICPICRDFLEQDEHTYDVIALMNNISSFGGVFTRRVIQIVSYQFIYKLIHMKQNLRLLSNYILNTIKEIPANSSMLKFGFNCLEEIMKLRDIESSIVIISQFRMQCVRPEFTVFTTFLTHFLEEQLLNTIDSTKVLEQVLWYIGTLVKYNKITTISQQVFAKIFNYHKSSNKSIKQMSLWCINEIILRNLVTLDTKFLSNFINNSADMIAQSPYEMKKEYAIMLLVSLLNIKTAEHFAEILSMIDFIAIIRCFTTIEDYTVQITIIKLLLRFIQIQKTRNPSEDISKAIPDDIVEYIDEIGDTESAELMMLCDDCMDQLKRYAA